MSSSLRLLAAALPAMAVALDTSVIQEPGLIRFPVTATQGSSIFGTLAKRQVDTASFGARSGTLYTINVVLGTPGQTVPVQFDTGSSEMWVNPTCSQASNMAFCLAQPRFTYSNSLVDFGVTGAVTYPTGGYANFQYIGDFVRIGPATITQQIFGAGYSTKTRVVGVLGAAPDLGGWISPYPFVIDSMAQQGLINSRAFSMNLRGFDSASGSVIFGGIDTKKYTGSLLKTPVVTAAQSPDGFTRWYVRVSGIKVNQPDGTVVDVYTVPAGGLGQPFLLGSGYTLSALPTAIFNNLVAAFPSTQYVPSTGLYTVDCLDPGEGGSVDFIFSAGANSKTISVRYYDFVWHNPDTPNTCVLGAFADPFPVLGDTFLRSAYVVFDHDNRNVHLAQSAECGTNLVAIGQGTNAVPSLEGGCSPPVTSTTSTAPPTTSTSAPPDSTTSTEPPTSTTEPPVTTSTSALPDSSTTCSAPLSSTSVPSSTPTPAPSSASTQSTTRPHTRPSVGTHRPSRPVDTITFTRTDTYTITSCAAHVTNCRAGHVTTKVIPVTTTVCPQTTAIYALPQVVVCPQAGGRGCTPGETVTTRVSITVKPHAPGGQAFAVPTQGGGHGEWAHPTGSRGPSVPGGKAPSPGAAAGGGHGGQGNGGNSEWYPTAPAGAPGAGGSHPLTTLATQAPATGYGAAKPTGVYTAGAAKVAVSWLVGVAVFGVMML